MDFLKWYKNTVKSSDLNPPENTWDNIQDQLDIDNSWHVINDHLSRQARFTIRIRVAAAASLLILIVTGAGLIYLVSENSDKQQFIEKIAPPESTMNEPGTPPENNRPQQQDELAEEVIEEMPVMAEKEDLQLFETLHPDSDYKQIEEDQGEISFKDYIAETYEPVIKEVRIVDTYSAAEPHAKEISIIIDADSIQHVTYDGKRNAFRKFYIGSTGQLANTWLVNQKTINGFKSTSLVSTNASFGSNFGVFAGTNLSNNIDLQLDLNILSQNNQSYHEYLNGHYISNKLKFNYSQLALSLRYNMISTRFMQGEHGINFGSYLAYLHNAYQKIDDETLSLANSYNNLDYGLMFSYEYVFPLYGRLGLGTGVRTYYGLSNIYSGYGDIPDYLNKTHTASVNITLSLKYLIR